jgi:tetratricopeptide (TPR) repeat protein
MDKTPHGKHLDINSNLPATGEALPQNSALHVAPKSFDNAGSHYQTLFAAEGKGDDPSTFLRVAAELVANQKTSEADMVLAEAAASFPKDERVLHEYAMIASYKRDWPETCRRWELLREEFPHTPHYHVQVCRALHFGGKPAEADTLLDAAMSKFPHDLEVARDFARLASLRGEPLTALARWVEVRRRFPDRAEGYTLGTQPLLELGRFDEAESLLESCRERFGNTYDFMYQSATLATRRDHWEKAFERWAVLLAAFPSAASGTIAIGKAISLWQLSVSEGDEQAINVKVPKAIAERVGIKSCPSAAAVQPSLLSDRDLMMAFEGLGDQCEFGVVQRHFGAEPIGLLRWSGITPADLASALETRFAGTGEAENTFVGINGGEYFAGDRRYFQMHTFISEHDMKVDVVLEKMRKRIKYLSEKLCHDLETGGKIFVYKTREADLSAGQANGIIDAMRNTYPKSRILLIRLADPQNLPGSVRMDNANVIFGYLSRFVFPLNAALIPYNEWRQICAAVVEI